MLQLARNVLGVIAALALMLLLAGAAFIVSRSTPGVSVGWYLGVAGIAYTMIVLLWLHR